MCVVYATAAVERDRREDRKWEKVLRQNEINVRVSLKLCFRSPVSSPRPGFQQPDMVILFRDTPYLAHNLWRFLNLWSLFCEPIN